MSKDQKDSIYKNIHLTAITVLMGFISFFVKGSYDRTEQIYQIVYRNQEAIRHHDKSIDALLTWKSEHQTKHR